MQISSQLQIGTTYGEFRRFRQFMLFEAGPARSALLSNAPVSFYVPHARSRSGTARMHDSGETSQKQRRGLTLETGFYGRYEEVIRVARTKELRRFRAQPRIALTEEYRHHWTLVLYEQTLSPLE